MANRLESTVTADWTLGGPHGTVQAKLVVLSGDDEGRELPIDAAVVVGTDPSCQLNLRDRTVSRRHAEFALADGRVRVRDLKSRNGTLVGQHKVHEAELPLGSVVRLGDTLIGVHPRWHVREVGPSQAREFGDLSGQSLRMRELFAVLERVSPTDVTVLVEGESGTGKELVARSVHAASARSDQPYVVFDCASVPRELSESELFGHRRGAFSGAVADRAGAFQRAHGGTLFLDELGELPLELQPKLLRVLETGDMRAVGDDTRRNVNIRLIAATNRDLRAEVRRGRFREDLLYRLDVVTIRLPPLRERFEDIPGLVARLLQGQAEEPVVVDGPNLQRLMAHTWPGNVRELRNVLDRAVALSERPVRFDSLVFNLGAPDAAPSTIGGAFPGVAAPMPYKQAKDQLLEDFERAYVDALLSRHGGNHTQAASAAGLSRKHLYDLIKKHHRS